MKIKFNGGVCWMDLVDMNVMKEWMYSGEGVYRFVMGGRGRVECEYMDEVDEIEVSEDVKLSKDWMDCYGIECYENCEFDDGVVRYFCLIN